MQICMHLRICDFMYIIVQYLFGVHVCTYIVCFYVHGFLLTLSTDIVSAVVAPLRYHLVNDHASYETCLLVTNTCHKANTPSPETTSHMGPVTAHQSLKKQLERSTKCKYIPCYVLMYMSLRMCTYLRICDFMCIICTIFTWCACMYIRMCVFELYICATYQYICYVRTFM